MLESDAENLRVTSRLRTCKAAKGKFDHILTMSFLITQVIESKGEFKPNNLPDQFAFSSV